MPYESVDVVQSSPKRKSLPSLYNPEAKKTKFALDESGASVTVYLPQKVLLNTNAPGFQATLDKFVEEILQYSAPEKNQDQTNISNNLKIQG